MDAVRALCERVFVTRSERDHDAVRRLLARGHSDREVAAISGVSPNTVGRWRRSWPAIRIEWQPAHEPSYTYLLGLYLGDGCLSITRGRVVLRVALDLSYPRIVDDCWTAIVLTRPSSRPSFVRCHGGGAVHVQACGKLWLHAFPQHGSGRKHERKIALEPWQQEIVARHPGEFVRGLIHSRRVSHDQPLSDDAAERAGRRVRLCALLLLEPVGRHSRSVLLDL